MVLPIAARLPLSLVLALAGARLADEWWTYVPAGVLPQLRADVGLSYAQAGVVLTSLMAGGLLGHGLWVAADFISRRLLATGGALVYGLCMIAFAISDQFAVLVMAGLLWGAASDAFIGGCEVALVEFAGDDLTAALARVNTYGAVGDLLGPLTLAGAALVGLSWRVPFAVGGALMLAYGGWLATQPLPRPRHSGDAHTPLASVWSVLKDRRVLALAAVAALFSVLDEPFWGFTLAYLEQTRRFTNGEPQLVVAAGVSGGIVGYLLVPLVVARWGIGPVLVGATVLVGVGIVGLLVSGPLPLIILAGALFGIAGAVFWSLLEARYLSLRPGQAGATAAVVSSIGLIGIGIGMPPLVGFVSDLLGLSAGLWVYAGVPAAMLLILLAARSTTTPRP